MAWIVFIPVVGVLLYAAAGTIPIYVTAGCGLVLLVLYLRLTQLATTTARSIIDERVRHAETKQAADQSKIQHLNALKRNATLQERLTLKKRELTLFTGLADDDDDYEAEGSSDGGGGGGVVVKDDVPYKDMV